MTRSSQADQHSARSASLASEMASTQSQQPRQLPAEYRADPWKGRVRSICGKVGEATHRGNATIGLNSAEAEAAAPRAQHRQPCYTFSLIAHTQTNPHTPKPILP